MAGGAIFRKVLLASDSPRISEIRSATYGLDSLTYDVSVVMWACSAIVVAIAVCNIILLYLPADDTEKR